MFKKSMQKHIFQNFKYLFFIYIKKKHSKHVRVLAVCNTQKQVLYFSLSKNTNITINHN